MPVPANVQHVAIPEGMTAIPEHAFRGCSSLQSIVIPDGVTEIGNGAFYGCSALRSITMPDSVTRIEEEAFFGCSALQSVIMSDNVTETGSYAFAYCSALQSVTIPDSLTEIGNHVFEGCSGLRSVTIPDSVTKINTFAFGHCAGLRSVTIPDSVTEIDDAAFLHCINLQSVTIPDSVTAIGNFLFCYCRGLQSVTIPDSITIISKSAFAGCKGLRSVTIPDGVTYISSDAFSGCSGLQSVTMPGSITDVGHDIFAGCPALRSVMYKGVNIAALMNINGYGVSTFGVIRTLAEHQIPLSENTVRTGIALLHQNRLSQWMQDYPVFGEMRFSATARSVDPGMEERLRQCFAEQKRTKGHIPEILDKLAITVRICGIPPERLTATFDIGYTKALICDRTPIVPAEACRCYYDRNTCNMLIRKGKISVMAEAIALYNRSGHRECYRHLMDFILSHPDIRTEDLQYAADHAEEIPMKAGITPAQVRQHRAYTESIAEVRKIETKYGKTVPGFRLSGYPCNLALTCIVYDGMTARVLDLSDKKDIALAAGLGELTDCCQCFGSAGETAMMHGFLNPDAGFWVIEDKDGTVKAQAEVWEANGSTLVFDNIEFAHTDNAGAGKRIEQLRGVIAAWAAKSGYTNIIMGCGYNELGVDSMEQAPIPELRLTPEEVFVLQKKSNAEISFREFDGNTDRLFGNVDEARQYMQTGEYRPEDFVYTDAGRRCVYIKKDGAVSGYLTKAPDRTATEKHCPDGYAAPGNRDNGFPLI